MALALLGCMLSACAAYDDGSPGGAGRDAAGAPGKNGESAESSEDDVVSVKKDASMVRVRVFNEQGELVGPVSTTKVVKSDAQWQKQLSPEQYRIARGKGTERAFCGTLLDNKKEGVYTCICCSLPLFASNAKFNSGTGWPSFFQPIAKENVLEQADNSHGMRRVEILCARCDGHLGHVFEDGPEPTGLRFCLNSESLAFTPIEDVKKLADPAATPASGKDDRAMTQPASTAKAVFAGGCFWCVEAVFEELDGVIDAISGYAGGSKETANYKDVCTGSTGHAEAVEIIYDPAKISYEELLKVHFALHDPTTLNRQGADSGTQYRSAIFYANEQEKELAQAFIDDLKDAKAFSSPIVTTLEPLKAFYPAETYHQNYVCKNPNQGYVKSAALPKVEKVRQKFKDMLKEKSPLSRNGR
jgi:peptide methionine sulfoxide reductase msrA/msrB